MNSPHLLSPTTRLLSLPKGGSSKWIRWGVALSLIGLTQGAAAQNAIQQPGPLPAFGRSTVANADSTAIVENPANLAFLPGPELRWTGAFLKEDVEAASQGNAFGLAFPFGFLPLATGFRFDMINPPGEASLESYGRSVNYQWFTWALAAGSDTASIGFSYQHSYSNALEVHGFDSWNIGVNARPSDYFGISAGVQNINAPTSDGGE